MYLKKLIFFLLLAFPSLSLAMDTDEVEKLRSTPDASWFHGSGNFTLNNSFEISCYKDFNEPEKPLPEFVRVSHVVFTDISPKLLTEEEKEEKSREIYKRHGRYKVEEENGNFYLMYNPNPELEDSTWQEIYRAEGSEPDIEVGHGGKVVLSWYHRGRNAVLFKDTTIVEQGLVGICMSRIHRDAHVSIERRLPGQPVTYRLYVDGNVRGEFDTNVNRISDFKLAIPAYVPNTLDSALPEGTPNRLPQMQVPVTLYKGDPSKPTLLAVKGGPMVVTKHGVYDPVYQALAKTGLNIVVVEYRGSPGCGNHSDVIAGDLGGGVVRDIRSVLDSLLNGDPLFEGFNREKVLVFGHSFGGLCVARLLQDYPDELREVKGVILSAGIYDVHANGDYLTQHNPGSSINWKEYLVRSPNFWNAEGQVLSREEIRGKLNEVHQKRSEINKKESPTHRDNLNPYPDNIRTLLVSGTHDGTVSVEQTIKFFATLLYSRISEDSRFVPFKYFEETCDFSASRDAKLTPKIILEEFRDWLRTIHPIAQEKASYFNLELINGATHNYVDDPETFRAYLEVILNFINDSRE